MIACNRYKNFAYVSALRKSKEKKKQASFSSILKNVPNTNEASSSDSRPLLKNNMQKSRACYDSQTYLDTDTYGLV